MRIQHTPSTSIASDSHGPEIFLGRPNLFSVQPGASIHVCLCTYLPYKKIPIISQKNIKK